MYIQKTKKMKKIGILHTTYRYPVPKYIHTLANRLRNAECQADDDQEGEIPGERQDKTLSEVLERQYLRENGSQNSNIR